MAQFYADPITKGLRKTFDNYHKQYRQNPSFYHVGIENMRPYFYLFAEKFIVMDIQETGFGGSFVTIMISPKKRFLWQLWISQIDTEEYNIREIKEIATNKEDAQQLTSLISEKLMKYWL
ncbi:MAG: hypothetical protein HY877_07705 [Deltaproteobacteria bacterium]|nr:hypothetical protein [Deltaproteobacteria bacterium]